MKANDEALKPIVNKWGKKKRRKEVTFLCYSIIRSSHDQIERTYDVVNDLPDFDAKRIHLQQIIVGYLDKYNSQKFSLFPHALDRRNNLKNKDEWAKELDDFFLRIIN